MSKATPEQARALHEMISSALLPHLKALVTMAKAGEIAVLVIRPVEYSGTLALLTGWDGRTDPAFLRMSDESRQRLATSDAVTAAWCERRGGPARVLVLSGEGSLLLNVAPGRGYYFEPGSLDSERV